MKKSPFFGISLLTAFSTAAAIIELDITGPAGNGLRGGNEVPANGSTALGFELSPGMRYNNDNPSARTIEIHFGWGDHQFVMGSDLTADFSGVHIHGPATVSQGGAPVLYSLQSFYSPASTGGRDGFVDGTLTLVDLGSYTVAQQEVDLLGGLWYLNVHSSDGMGGGFPGGEIRGQLTPIPEPTTYTALFGLGLLGWAGFRRFKHAAVK